MSTLVGRHKMEPETSEKETEELGKKVLAIVFWDKKKGSDEVKGYAHSVLRRAGL